MKPYTVAGIRGVILAGLVVLAGCATGAEPERVPATGTSAEAGGMAFVDAAKEVGLGGFVHETGAEGDLLFPESMGSGCAFIDYDGDGWLDVLLAGGGTWPGGKKKPVLPVRLYHNRGDGTFTEATEAAGLTDVKAYSLGFAVADYDNDGDQDFYLTTLAENLLFRNDAGVFTEVGRAAGVADPPVWGASALFFDADRDGWLDLFASNYVKWSVETDLWCSLDGDTKGYCTPEAYPGEPGRFYRNNGDGTFTDRSEEAGFLPSPGKNLGVVDLDFNHDGWPDLIVSNDTEPTELYVNDGDGTFTERAALSGMAFDENGKTRAGMGVEVGVVDTTGQETLFIGNFSKEMIAVYRYMGDGLWLDRAAASKIGRSSLMSLTFGLVLFDADWDGDLDLFAANGHVQPDVEHTQEGIAYAQPSHLYVNQGDGTFEDRGAAVGGALGLAIVSRGAAYGDFDRDGDVDLLISENAGPARLFRNDTRSDHHYLRVHLTGRESNRDGIGARVVVHAGGRAMERWVRGGSSYLSASERVATFGLGTAVQADSLAVYWPSGRIDRYAAIPAGRDVRVEEGAAAPVALPAAGPGRLADADG